MASVISIGNPGGSRRTVSVTTTRIREPGSASSQTGGTSGGSQAGQPSYTDQLSQLLGAVTSSTQQLAKQQQSLQQQALNVQKQQLREAQVQSRLDESAAQAQARDSYVGLLQQILLNS